MPAIETMTDPSQAYRGAKVLVTGGLGFIGSNVAIRLAGAGARVTVVDSLDPTCGGNMFNIDPVVDEIDVRIGDVRDPTLMRDVLRGQQYVFNLAGHISHIQSMDDPFNDLELNCRSTLALLEACRYVNRDARLVFASTRQTYGRVDELPVSEDALLRPVDVNGVNKMAAEWFHLVYNSVHGIRSLSLRLVNTFGPRQLLRHARQGFIGWFVRLAVDGDEISVFGDGTQIRDINYIDDVVDALLVAGANDDLMGGIFNLGSPRPVSLEEFVRALVRVSGNGSYKLVPFPDDRKSIDVGSFYTDYSRFREATGWEPKVELEDGLARTLEYYRQNRERYWD